MRYGTDEAKFRALLTPAVSPSAIDAFCSKSSFFHKPRACAYNRTLVARTYAEEPTMMLIGLGILLSLWVTFVWFVDPDGFHLRHGRR